MRRQRDDRPRPSQPKLPPPKGQAPPPPPLQCVLCQALFDVDAQKKRHHRIRNDGSIVCSNERACRGRRLDAQIGKELKGDAWREDSKPWLFSKFPRELTWDTMDVRPKDWKATGWMPRFELWERVLACIVWHSWCYPVSLHYAVQVRRTCPLAGRDDPDPDDFVIDEYGRPRLLRVCDIGRILNEQWQGNNGNVPRAMRWLRDRKVIRVDEDHAIMPAAKLADLSIEERQALWGFTPPAAGNDGSDFWKRLRAVPKRLRPLVVAVEERCPDAAVRSDVVAAVWGACSSFNDGIRELRTTRDSMIRAKCSEGTNLIPDFGRDSISSSSRTAPADVPLPSQSQPPDDDDRPSLNEQYAAGLGDGALATLPPREERPAAYIAVKMAELIGAGEEDAASQLLDACRIAAPDITIDEIVAGMQRKAKLARSKDNPTGFLIVAVPKLFAGRGLARIRAEERLTQQTLDDAEAIRQGKAAVAQAAAAEWQAMTAQERADRIEVERKQWGQHLEYSALDSEEARWRFLEEFAVATLAGEIRQRAGPGNAATRGASP
jgi:hypothetical protein